MRYGDLSHCLSHRNLLVDMNVTVNLNRFLGLVVVIRMNALYCPFSCVTEVNDFFLNVLDKRAEERHHSSKQYLS